MLVGALALSIGLAIYDLTVRELDLSATATQSQYAIYAADSGAECALYWDNKYGGQGSAFGTSSGGVWGSGVVCNGQTVSSSWTIESNASAATTTFSLTLAPQSSCVTVTLAKSGNPPQTTVTSYGRNTCATGTARIERALQVHY